MEEEYRGIWVYGEQRNGRLVDVTLELLGKGRELSDSLNEELAVVLLGHNVRHLCDELIKYGADIVYLADHPELKDYRSLSYTRVVGDLIRTGKPRFVLFGATLNGRCVASRIAARLRTGMASDCTDFKVSTYDKLPQRASDRIRRLVNENSNKIFLLQIRPDFNGFYVSTILTPNHRPQMANSRPGVFPIPSRDENRMGKVVDVEVRLEASDLSSVIEKSLTSAENIEMAGSRVVVSVGTGIARDPDLGVKLATELAETLGGTWGASRGAVMAEYKSRDGKVLIDHARQVGLTGKTVKPKLYVALGISGQVQHIAGMKKSDVVIAVNSDPNAPIKDYSDFFVQGDVFEVVPKMIELARRFRMNTSA